MTSFPSPGTHPATDGGPASASATTALQKAEYFLEHERAFRLGALPTEQPHPHTAGLAETLQRDVRAGLARLLEVDRDVAPVAEKVFASEAYAKLKASLERALTGGGRVYFTGCGATGRLAILLEASWRRHCLDHAAAAGDGKAREAWEALADRVRSVMAGGDFALIRSVEGFEDFADFGRHQLREAGEAGEAGGAGGAGGVSDGDVVVAVTEGGETSFVIGTAWEALDAGAESFFVFNNPAEVLAQHVERSRQVVEEPRIVKLDLATGPMAVAGSTRMQATTIELLVLGTALEAAAAAVGGKAEGGAGGSDASGSGSGSMAPVAAGEAARRFSALLEALLGDENLEAMARLTRREAELYRDGGLVTYFADAFLLDILTDTTERSPTFSLPPFRPRGDERAASSWSFVKDPSRDSTAAWTQMLGRPPGGLDWDRDQYAQMNAPAAVRDRPPDLSRARIYRFMIGNEPDEARTHGVESLAVSLLVGPEVSRHGQAGSDFAQRVARQTRDFDAHAILSVGPALPEQDPATTCYAVRCDLPATPLSLWSHLAAKLVLNTVSTASMGIIGRLTSNWMIYVNTSNKKLIDRGARLIADQTAVSYEQACRELFETLNSPDAEYLVDGKASSPVAVTIDRIKQAGVGHR